MDTDASVCHDFVTVGRLKINKKGKEKSKKGKREKREKRDTSIILYCSPIPILLSFLVTLNYQHACSLLTFLVAGLFLDPDSRLFLINLIIKLNLNPIKCPRKFPGTTRPQLDNNVVQSHKMQLVIDDQ